MRRSERYKQQTTNEFPIYKNILCILMYEIIKRILCIPLRDSVSNDTTRPTCHANAGLLSSMCAVCAVCMWIVREIRAGCIRMMNELNDEDDAWTARDDRNRGRHKGINKKTKKRRKIAKKIGNVSFTIFCFVSPSSSVDVRASGNAPINNRVQIKAKTCVFRFFIRFFRVQISLIKRNTAEETSV